MKVIKEVKWEHAFTCTGCKSELLAEEDDVQVVSYEDSGSDYYVECPCCGTWYHFKEKLLTPKITSAAWAKRK